MCSPISVEDVSTHEKYDCYGWVTGDDGIVYGVCYPQGKAKAAISCFKLIIYYQLKPVQKECL